VAGNPPHGQLKAFEAAQAQRAQLDVVSIGYRSHCRWRECHAGGPHNRRCSSERSLCAQAPHAL
jgi:hypothetical protein